LLILFVCVVHEIAPVMMLASLPLD